ncbi:MAG TPA: 5'/3'-nucleotidase SurE, partial [Methylocella sp.]|nr:5'/3'-nucleotidase SurE [Methylocella sp.]
VAVTAQGRRDVQTVTVEERADGRGKAYYWITVARENSTPAPGTDLAALAQNTISVTPLKLDLTGEHLLTRYARELR